jgi:hypothetical protein
MRLFAKSPMDMRIEAEGMVRRSTPPPGPIDPAARPRQASDDEENAWLDACADWLAHVEAGRIAVK